MYIQKIMGTWTLSGFFATITVLQAGQKIQPSDIQLTETHMQNHTHLFTHEHKGHVMLPSPVRVVSMSYCVFVVLHQLASGER